jgi:hypothetical protein
LAGKLLSVNLHRNHPRRTKKYESMSKQKSKKIPVLNQVIIEMNDRLLKLVQSRDHAKEVENFDQVQIKNTHIFIYEKIIEEVLLPKLKESENQHKDDFISGYKYMDRTICSNEQRAEKWFKEMYEN